MTEHTGRTIKLLRPNGHPLSIRICNADALSMSIYNALIEYN